MDDALARLRNRQRPTVPNRDASLTPGSADISTSRNLDSAPSPPPQGQGTPAQIEAAQSSQPAPIIPEVQNSRSEDISIPTLPETENLNTKQSTLRLETGLSDRLQSLCRDEGICREVFIEALFEYFEAHPNARSEILLTAQAKNEHRQHIANLKRAQSMMKRFSPTP